ncbi:hypothetical protein K504DRAFT_451211 [Pleomassaria siparia CBS 279.74]|uniref:NB-ARC domain-containing protein n=1 Tax=Pleomassaria siparia CBS 279.74 TaxID=1314801 RepID=A0A6G1JV14_9PLEO|nr:hypothetical protein K504DRAFT_451211 [Pleomassaria siparia CBS 279.74]
MEALSSRNASRSSTDIAEYAKAVLFLVTPHRGSSFSTWGGIAARVLRPLGSNPLLLRELTYDSVALLDIQEEFETAFSNKLQVINFFERRKTRLLKLWFVQWEAFCVTEQSAKYGSMNIGLDVDHYGLNKFKSATDDKYILVRNQLLDTIKPISPQKQKRLYNVPHDTVESYTERQALSTAVAEKLRVQHPKARVQYALTIYGLGGSGKTQLALKYIEDHKNEYNPILWIDGNDQESVLSSFERCASELQLQIDASRAQNTNLADSPHVRAVLKWLRHRKQTDDRWLVVIDNADDVKWWIGNVVLIPEGDQGSIIITSQDSHSRKLVRGGCEELSIGTMKVEEARALLIQHLRLDSDPVPEDVVQDCDKIVELLGCLALAVDLAGAYIGDDGTDPKQALRQYLVDYTKHQDDLLQSEDFCGSSASNKTVWTVWNTTLERIETRYANLRPGSVLAFLARFQGVVVQDELLRLASLGMSTVLKELYDTAVELPCWLDKALTVEEQQWDQYCYRESRRILVRYGLLQRIEGYWPGVSMHGLVQWRARKYKEKQPWEKWHHTTVLAAFVTHLLEEKAETYFSRDLVVHIPALDEAYLSNMQVGNMGKFFIWQIVSKMLYDKRSWTEAEDLQVQWMEIGQRALGKEHPSTIASMTHLALTYQSQSRWKEAEELFAKVIKIQKRVLREEHLDTLTSIHKLAITYWLQERLTEAEELFVELIEIRKRVLGEEHVDTLTSMHLLASTYYGQSWWKEAEELFVQLIEIRKRVLGEEHVDTLASMHILASTYWNQGRWKEAEELELQVLEIRKRVLGKTHTTTLSSMHNLTISHSCLRTKADFADEWRREVYGTEVQDDSATSAH